MYYSAFVDLIRKLVVLVPTTSPHIPKTGFHFLGLIKHSKEEDNYGEEISHVYYQHVRQLLLSQEKVTDMQNFQILNEAAFRDLLYPEEIIEDALFLLEEIALLNGHLYKLNEWYALNEFIVGNAAVLDNPFIQENEAQDFLNQLTTLYEALILKQPDCSVPKLEAVADSEGKIVLVPEMSLDIENFYEDLFSTTDPEKTPKLEETYPPYSSTYIKKESEGITTIELTLPAEYEQAIIKLVPRSAHRVFETYEPFFGAKITIDSDNVVSFRGNTPHVTHEPIKVTDISDRIDAVGIHYNHNTNSYGFSLGNNIYGTMPEAEGLSTVDPQFLDLVVEVTGATQGSKVIVYQDNTLFTLNHPKGSKTVCGELVETYRGNVDLRTLNAALDWVERIRTNPDEYTTASTEDLFALADRVKEDIKALYLTQDDVNGYVGELSELLRWVDHHQYFSDFTVNMIEIDADKSQLQALVDESQQIQQGNYNLCSWNYFQLALTKLGEPALANENSSQLAVDDAYSVLLAAKNGLTENSHDFTQLQALLDEASEYVSFDSVFVEWLEVVRWVAYANTLMSTSGCFNNSLVGDVEVKLREAIDNYHQAILDATPEPEDCVYPLSIAVEEAADFGAEVFESLDECFNHFKSEGNNDSFLVAAGSGVLESLVAGNNVPDNYVIRSGEALEVEVSWSTPDDVSYSILNLSILDEVESAQLADISIYRNPISGEDALVFVRERITHTSNEVVSSNNTARIGLYYIEDELLVIVDGQVMLSCASSGGIGIFAVKDENGYSSTPPTTSSPVEFKLLTKAKDLTFTYPEGTRGLDGELV